MTELLLLAAALALLIWSAWKLTPALKAKRRRERFNLVYPPKR